MRCSLYANEKELIKKSHITADFFYRNNNLYDSKHAIKNFTVIPKTEQIKRGKPLRTEVDDKNILCKECDNEKKGQNETYLKSLFFGGKLGKNEVPEFKNTINDKNQEFTECTNILYRKTKLGLLSIL